MRVTPCGGACVEGGSESRAPINSLAAEAPAETERGVKTS